MKPIICCALIFRMEVLKTGSIKSFHKLEVNQTGISSLVSILTKSLHTSLKTGYCTPARFDHLQEILNTNRKCEKVTAVRPSDMIDRDLFRSAFVTEFI